jgi:hypothetical protein
MQNEIIKGRCMDCLYFKATNKRQINGLCKDNREGRKSVRVTCIDYCEDFIKKGA